MNIEHFRTEDSPEAKAIIEYYDYASIQLRQAKQDNADDAIGHWTSVKFAIRRLSSLVWEHREKRHIDLTPHKER